MENKPTFRMKPLIIKKGNLRILNTSLKNERSFTTEDLYKEDVLYDTSDMYFLKGEYQRLLLVNRFNILSKQSRAVAKYYSKDGSVVEKTSDRVTEVIGQEQFKTVFTALCSILDEELKIRSILSLLTLKAADKKLMEPVDIKKEDIKSLSQIKIFMENSCQTDEMRIEKAKPRKRNRKPISPYIVADNKIADENQSIAPEKKKVKRLIVNLRTVNQINPDTLEQVTLQRKTIIQLFNDSQNQENSEHLDPLSTLIKTDLMSNLTALDRQNKTNTNSTNLESQHNSVNFIDLDSHHILPDLDSHKRLTDLGFLNDEYSNDSLGKLSALSNTSTNPELLTNPQSLISNIDQHTRDLIVPTGFIVPGTDIRIPYKPEDIFHIATKDNLQNLDIATRKKLLQHQLSVDYEHCLSVLDDNGNLPIHIAVRNNDAELLVRQCIVLKMRGCSIDIPDQGPTALQLAIESSRGALAASLLRHGACPLRSDAAHRAAAHLAAERDADVLRTVLVGCQENARKILYENEDLWKPEMEKQTDEQLAKFLLKYMCSMFNKQGYNPLMLASMLGLYENVRVLIEHSPNVNDQMPTSGNTALYLAVAAACNKSIELGDKSKIVDHFRQTVEILLQNGADPSIENNNGINVHTLLQEFNNRELSMIIANKRYLQLLNKKAQMPIETDIAKVMLVLGKGGDIQCKALENERKKASVKPVKKSTDKNLVIVEDVVLKPGNTESSVAKRKVDKPIIDSKNLKVFQIVDNVPKIVSSEKVVIVPNAKKNNAGKRKQSDAPKMIKQAKINK